MSDIQEHDVVLTDEMRNKLKGQLGFRTDANFKFVQKVYRKKDADDQYIIPKALWPVWTLKAKNGLEVSLAEDDAGYVSVDKNKPDEPKFMAQSGSGKIQALEKGIKGVTKFWMEDYSFVNYDAKTADLTTVDANGKSTTKNNIRVRKLIEIIPTDVQAELANAINDHSTLSDEELLGLE